MDILNTILQNGLDKNVISTISKKSGIGTQDIESLITNLTPKLLDGVKGNLASDNDSSDLINMISNTNLDSIKQNPADLDNTNNGNNILGQLFSSLNESEDDVAQELSNKSGVDKSSIASLLPMVAPLILGAINQKTNLGATDTSNTNNITSALLNFIDQDKDGSVVDDLIDFAGKFFK